MRSLPVKFLDLPRQTTWQPGADLWHQNIQCLYNQDAGWRQSGQLLIYLLTASQYKKSSWTFRERQRSTLVQSEICRRLLNGLPKNFGVDVHDPQRMNPDDDDDEISRFNTLLRVVPAYLTQKAFTIIYSETQIRVFWGSFRERYVWN